MKYKALINIEIFSTKPFNNKKISHVLLEGKVFEVISVSCLTNYTLITIKWLSLDKEKVVFDINSNILQFAKRVYDED